VNCSDQIRSNPVRKSELQAVRAANAQKDDVLARKKMQHNTPEYYAVSVSFVLAISSHITQISR
jgi:hypothetical protein